MIKRRWVIYDWVGNVVNVGGKTFSSFESAWDYILGEMTGLAGLHEEDYSEYYVEVAS